MVLGQWLSREEQNLVLIERLECKCPQWGYSYSTPDTLPLESPPTSNELGDPQIGLLLCFEGELSGH